MKNKHKNPPKQTLEQLCHLSLGLVPQCGAHVDGGCHVTLVCRRAVWGHVISVVVTHVLHVVEVSSSQLPVVAATAQNQVEVREDGVEVRTQEQPGHTQGRVVIFIDFFLNIGFI